MSHQRVAEAGAAAGTEIHHPFGHSAFFEQFDKLRRDGRRIARRLQDDGVAADDRGQRHAGHDGAGKIPRRNHRAHAQRNVGQGVALAGQLHRRLGLGEAQRLARVELAEVDGLGDVGIGLKPVLRNFKDQPGHEFQLALAHQIAHAKQQRRALFGGSVSPAFEGLRSGIDGGLNVLLAGFLMDADHFGGFGRIDGTDLVRGLDAFAANDQVILAAQLPAHFFERGAHLAHILFLAEIDKRFVLERTFMQADLQTRRGFHGCHRRSFPGRKISADVRDV